MRVLAVVGLALAACSGPPKPEGEVIEPDTDASDLLLDGSKLYWENGVFGGIFDLSIAPLDATPSTLVAADASLSAAAGDPTSIAIENGVVYWTNINQATRSGGSVWSVPISGGTPTALVAGLDQPSGIVVDGTNLYFIDDNVLYVTTTQGGNFVQVASDVREFHLAGTRGVWTTMSTPVKLFELDLSVSQATPVMLPMPAYPDAFAVDDSNVYLRSTGPGDLTVTVAELPLSGGTARTLFHAFIDDGAFVQRLVLDGGELYWNARTQILRIAVDGSGLERPVQNDVDITGFAVSSDAIYLATTRKDVPTPMGSCACPVIVKTTK